MKKYFVALLICLWLTSCASVSPVGSWKFNVTGTPDGDHNGTLVVVKNKKEYNATLKSEVGEVPFTKFAFDAKTKKTSGDFDYEGTPIHFEAAVTKTNMDGTVSTDDARFPFKATREK